MEMDGLEEKMGGIEGNCGKRGRKRSFLGDFLTFRVMVSPVLIQIGFWVGVLMCVGVGIGLIWWADVHDLDFLRKVQVQTS